ncbi:MAG: hypothetical protein GXP27_12805 [Planctomycetes bacterium]|nr:hypothetical protein [Planctomycetota bacterium]
MPYFDIIWNDEPGGNVEHIRQHGLTPEDVEAVLQEPIRTGVSRSSGRPIAFGFTPDGRLVCVVFEQVDQVTLYPVTAFVIDE